ncbi:hypothetical protein [Geomonas sp.]|uniref:hypothetical protein n=1 Tax=Geomonas sp. TaxID=2651584 RepID=UPI002B46D309|nr:hypothetical protein [Geomonas sp.]HJV34259.1 hypothetical protein [Geomonas sp.]
MLRLLHSIFGSEKEGSYPEALIKEAIERVVEGTDPWLRAVSGYKKKLRPAVVRAIDHVVTLVGQLPPALPARLAVQGEDSPLKRFFISSLDMRKAFREDPSLAEYLEKAGDDSETIVALLAMEKEERGIFGAELKGDVVIKDVPQVTLAFDAHRLIDPSADETATRRLLMRRAYDHLIGLALRELSAVKSEREELEKRRALLEAKYNLLQRGGWGFDQADPSGKLTVAEVERGLAEIEGQLKKLGGDDRMLDTYLALVGEVLGHPEQLLWGARQTVFVDRMGIKRAEASDEAPELSYQEIFNAEGRSMVVTLVSLGKEELALEEKG